MYGDDRWHLYDIKADPGETRPLEVEQPERLAALVKIYRAFAKEKGIVEVDDRWSPWHGDPEDK